jgi:hypothetical protein
MSKKHITFLLKVSISAGLVWLILDKIAPDWRKCGKLIAAAFSHGYIWLVAAVIVVAMVFWLLALRWKTILGGHEISIRLAETFRLSLVGFFFAQFMPGGLAAGDVVRSYYIAGRTGEKKMEVVATVILDRVVGWVGLLTLVTVSLLLGGMFTGQYVTILAIIAAAGLGTLLFFSKGVLKKLPFAARIYEHLPYREHVARVYESFRHYREHKKDMVVCWVQSVMLQFLLVVAGYCVGQSVGVEATFVQYMIWVPLVGTISSVPITFGSVGTAEAGYVLLFLQGEHTDAYRSVVLAFALMMRLLWLAVGAVGGVIWWAEKGKVPRATPRQPIAAS